MTRPALLVCALLPALLLGACSTRQEASARDPRYVSLDAALDPGATARRPKAAPSPIASMPAWIGKPIRVRERDDASGFEQSIALGLPARSDARGNAILVSARRPGAASTGAASLDASALMGKPTEEGIRAELDAAFPGIAMQVSTRPAANSYGPYGLAIGRARSGARCLYAWQWIEEAREATGEEGPLSLRVRLCRDDITLEAMAAAVTQLRLGRRGERGDAAAAEEAPPQAAPRRRRARAVARRAPWRRVAERPAAPQESQARSPRPMIALTPPAGAGRRYLTADAARPQPATATPGLGQPAAAAPGLSIELPPEAYRGPGRAR